jgi:hypothetical protein
MPRVVPSQVVQVIEKYFPQTKITPNADFVIDRGHIHECVSIFKLLDQIPSELLNPPTVDDYIELVSNIEKLSYTLEAWKTPSGSHTYDLFGGGTGNPISIIRNVLLKCPDEAISSKTTGLEFIDDVIFRDSLRLDLSNVNSALSNGEWKATTILSGSVTEALLLWAINKVKTARQSDIDKAIEKHNIKDKDYNKWVLAQYNDVAKELNIIKEGTHKSVDLLRQFRDLIHPGREIRKNAKCSKATAHSGIAAVELVIEDLTDQFGKS